MPSLDQQTSEDYNPDQMGAKERQKTKMSDDQASLTFDAFRQMLGTDVGTSPWITVSQSMIDGFASLTDDHQFIHIDPARATAETPFGGTIAHGFLTLSLLSKMAYDALPQIKNTMIGVNYGFDKIRFLAPVPAGARIRGRFHLITIDERHPGEITSTYQVTIDIEGQEKPALSAIWLTRLYLDNQ